MENVSLACRTSRPYQLKCTSPPEFLLVRQPIEHSIKRFLQYYNVHVTSNDHPLKTKRININMVSVIKISPHYEMISKAERCGNIKHHEIALIM